MTLRSRRPRSLCLALLVATILVYKLVQEVESFVPTAPISRRDRQRSSHHTAILATRKTTKKRHGGEKWGSGNGGGFGESSMRSCSCGSKVRYAACCQKLHKDVNAYRMATPEQVVRARYSAYAKKQAEFLMASTHPLHKDFDTDLKRWKETIKMNMYDNCDMPKCVIVEESINEDMRTATVKFIAELVARQTGKKASFMEISTFERTETNGAWLYKDGTIQAVPNLDGVDGLVSESDEIEKGYPSIEEKLASLL